MIRHIPSFFVPYSLLKIQLNFLPILIEQIFKISLYFNFFIAGYISLQFDHK